MDQPKSPDRRTTTAPATCPRYSWCVERGQHDAHQSPDITLTPTAPGSGAVLAACIFADVEGGVVAAVDLGGWCQFDAATLRREVTRMRAHLDRIEALADQLAEIEGTGRDSR